MLQVYGVKISGFVNQSNTNKPEFNLARIRLKHFRKLLATRVMCHVFLVIIKRLCVCLYSHLYISISICPVVCVDFWKSKRAARNCAHRMWPLYL